MIPVKFRLPSGGFKAAGYRAVRTPHFSLKFKDNGTGVNRIGVVVGKSVDKRAVRRNFLERQAKTALLKAPQDGKDLIITLFPKTNALTKKEFTNELKKILNTI
jgi:ribonuclease P protein component